MDTIRDLLDLMEDLESNPETGDILDFEFGDDVLVETRVVENRDGDLLLEMDMDALEYLGRQFTFEDAEWQGVTESEFLDSHVKFNIAEARRLMREFTPEEIGNMPIERRGGTYGITHLCKVAFKAGEATDEVREEANEYIQASIAKIRERRGEELAKKAFDEVMKAGSKAGTVANWIRDYEHGQSTIDITDTGNNTQKRIGMTEGTLTEAEYRGRKVSLGKPFLTPDGPKKRSVYVKNPKGNVVKVNFGQKGVKIKKNNPARRKSFRARHGCDNPGPKHRAKYWSCKFW